MNSIDREISLKPIKSTWSIWPAGHPGSSLDVPAGGGGGAGRKGPQKGSHLSTPPADVRGWGGAWLTPSSGTRHRVEKGAQIWGPVDRSLKPGSVIYYQRDFSLNVPNLRFDGTAVLHRRPCACSQHRSPTLLYGLGGLILSLFFLLFVC